MDDYKQSLDDFPEITEEEMIYLYHKKSAFNKVLHNILDTGKIYSSDINNGSNVYNFDKNIKSVAIINRGNSVINIKIHGDFLQNKEISITVHENESFDDAIKGGTHKIEIETDSSYEIIFRN